MKRTLLFSLMALAVPAMASSPGAHQHGIAQLDVALEGEVLEIALHSPMANLVGFEHAPRTEEQESALRQAADTLRQGELLFAFPKAAGCNFQQADLMLPYDVDHHDEHGDEHHDEHGDEHHDEHEDEHHAEHHDEHKDEHHAEHDDEHEDDHHAEHHDEHKDEHHAEHHDEHGDEHHADHDDEHEEHHSDVQVAWRFQCAKPAQLANFDTQLFEQFAGLEQLQVQVISDDGQLGQKLNAQQAELRLP